MTVRFVAYVDESGDTGIEKIKPFDPKGASEWLVLSCFLVKVENDTKLVGLDQGDPVEILERRGDLKWTARRCSRFNLGRSRSRPRSAAGDGSHSCNRARARLPLLRPAAVVKGLQFPRKVRDYFEVMMSRIGYEPLPAV